MELTTGPAYLLDIVDMQHDFVSARGALPVPGAEAIVPAFNAFLKALDSSRLSAVLVKYDTHFGHEYPLSDEKTKFGFPDHCIWNTPGQKLSIELPPMLAMMAGHMNKNEFAMWQFNKLDKSHVTFDSAAEEQTYDNLFKVTRSFNDLTPGVPRDEWLAQLGHPSGVPVVMAGVASDYCVKQAMQGYLERGHRLIVLTDLVAGIGGEHSDAPSGNIREVAEKLFPAALRKGQLRLMTSEQFLRANGMKPPVAA